MAFDGTELGAKSTLSITVHSMEEGVGAWLLPQVAQLSAFGHFWSAAQFWRFRAFSGVPNLAFSDFFWRFWAFSGVFGRFRAFLGQQLSASGAGSAMAPSFGLNIATGRCRANSATAKLQPEPTTGVCHCKLLPEFVTSMCPVADSSSRLKWQTPAVGSRRSFR